ncbi:hypothetical protein A9B99_05935 [Mangrovibacter phragmitis]|uniref:Biopolymer transporter Tol n=1 Tax=Mangrovibacter phragmitis TaxID=1691903 RepID=A0A1B7L376_9ENTR|nr:DUF3748 domain-containing protein [Mangrovibacter phragmitis]OAT76854.1 hypothetical protein A9B99_05935 [Mangrovibacter phragmitis]
MKQVTFSPRHHQLTNINTWTPDSQWLVFDVRPSGSSFTSETVERVQIHSGTTEVIWRAQQGAHVGVITVNPQLPERYVFIHSPENPDENWQYDFHHRRGVTVCGGQVANLDALSITAPYFPGALRGGSHVHVWSPDGQYLSFTYNDHVLHERDPALDLRNVGVAVPFGPVNPPLRHSREYAGSHWCTLVSRTTPEPQPGSDEINRAYEEGWVGNQGYLKPNGERQRYALAFIGDTRSVQGETIPELFIVDLPDNEAAWKTQGDAPLAGTPETMPAPPAGVYQKRLTYTHHCAWPGLVNQPRHWVRASPDGEHIAFLMRDNNGVVQVWLVSPNGGECRQLTRLAHDVQSAINWHPAGKWLGFISEQKIVMCSYPEGKILELTAPQEEISGDAVVFSPDGQFIAWMQPDEQGFRQIYICQTGC